jgi:hypothetical protein
MIRPFAKSLRCRGGFASLCAATIFLTACKKHAESAQTQEEKVAAAPSPEVEAKIEAQLIPAANAKPDAPLQERLQGAVHQELTMRLQMYIDRTGKMPETIYEFANVAVDSMPLAPPGMKYAIDPADKTVKVVRKD